MRYGSLSEPFFASEHPTGGMAMLPPASGGLYRTREAEWTQAGGQALRAGNTIGRQECNSD